MTAFREFLSDRIDRGGFTTEDTLTVFLPLMRQVVETHDLGLVAPLDGVKLLQVDGNRVWFAESERRMIARHDKALRKVRPVPSRAVEVVGEVRHEIDITEGRESVDNLAVGDPEAEIVRPVYLPGYRSYEHVLLHHDPLTDTFVLGLILASLCLGTDLSDPEELSRFVSNRDNLFALSPELHPVLAKIIQQMTQLDRDRRPQDLSSLADSLEDYREQDFDIELDLLREPGFHEKNLEDRHQVILAKLQQRLFEISRRNRLLHYRQTQQSVNLTHASVPLSFDPENIRAEQILTWSGDFKKKVSAGKAFSLNKYLNFEEALYLPSLLDKIRAEARKDQAEFGFAQLRLVICFLRWSNLKEGKERYDSPLLLLPVKLTKKKGVRDAHQLEPLSNEAEINPVLRYYFRELYGLKLPEVVDLESADLTDLHRILSQQIQKSEPAVVLEMIEKPRISLIHRRARQRLDQFQKRSRMARRGTRTYPALDYSYSRSDFRPLGLQLFRQKVQVVETTMEGMLSGPRRKVHMAVPDEAASDAAAASTVRELKRSFYEIETGAGDNPYHWELDFCSVTLGNFKYRKMSLVRDYEALLAELPDNAAFDSVFSLTPPPTGPLPSVEVPLGDRHPVVACDPTQGRAIAYASRGDSYIIQGPPGTGKSQTITNLIADYVARGKRVLFVCEKRAAIDVVYHRLEQQGLGPLCCLVHDAQSDKKELIADLRNTYETFTQVSEEDEIDRAAMLEKVERELVPLVDSHAAMTEERQPLGAALRSSLTRALELQDEAQDLSVVEREALPPYRHWSENREGLDRLYAALLDAESSGVFRRHPLRLLRADVCEAERAGSEIVARVEPAIDGLSTVLKKIVTTEIPETCRATYEELKECAELAGQFMGLAQSGNIAVVDPRSDASRECSQRLQEAKELAAVESQARENSAGWRDPLPSGELPTALAQAKLLEGSFLAFLKPAWWRLRKVLRARFDFDRGVVKPTWSQALESLAERFECEARSNTAVDRLRADYGFGGEFTEFVAFIERVQSSELGGVALALREHLATSVNAADSVVVLDEIHRLLEAVDRELSSVVRDYEDSEPEQLCEELRRLMDSLDGLPEFSHCLVELQKLPEKLGNVIRTRDWSAGQIESSMVEATLFSELRRDRRINRFDGRQRDRVAGQLEKHYEQWLRGNAQTIRDEVRSGFLGNHALLDTKAADLSAEQKQTKKIFNAGLRELQHEFKKSRRYKSIRDLSNGESGVVLQQLKPVWLMSPLSVSDTLPMAADRFDVVIFDEASQITLEEAVPAIFRAGQIIVVGDEMQLPPTNFFSARKTADETDGQELDESVEYDLDSNSFLTHSARNLRSCMLGWHYRSRSESLISFSNQAFYNGELLTVPDERFAAEPRPEIVVSSSTDASRFVDDVLQRPVGFHFAENGVYESRRNRAEAEYIAQLVKDMLTREVGLSIGVVAFSQAQQSEIEDALDRLGAEDREFADRLEAEYEREEDGQFLGLLVKNLENIQGDERDVVIMSVCYGPDPKGKVRMNFGPINLSGGEKRLNVAFSRAKQHMVLVSSIRSSAVTNDYNVGANCLKNYLRYAEVSSLGDADGAARVLNQLRLGGVDGSDPVREPHPVAVQLGEELSSAGFAVCHSVGQSTFRCDLAVRRPGDSRYALGILVDGDDYFAETDALERDMMKPRLLRAFGWNVTHVLTKDWHADRPAEVERVKALLGEPPPSTPESDQLGK